MLHAKGALQPICLTPDPPFEKRCSKWNPNAYCKYHQGNGHTTSQCWTLKHNLENMVEDVRLHIPPAVKVSNSGNPVGSA